MNRIRITINYLFEVGSTNLSKLSCTLISDEINIMSGKIMKLHFYDNFFKSYYSKQLAIA